MAYITDNSYLELNAKEALQLARKLLDAVELVTRHDVRGGYDHVHIVGGNEKEVRAVRIRVSEETRG